MEGTGPTVEEELMRRLRERNEAEKNWLWALVNPTSIARPSKQHHNADQNRTGHLYSILALQEPFQIPSFGLL